MLAEQGEDVDWNSAQSHIFINPAYSSDEKQSIEKALYSFKLAFPGHLWVATSGSTKQKWVALSKKAFLTSAKAVNHHFDITAEDRWIHALPDFHVGGLSIWARSYLSQSKVFDFKKNHIKWSPLQFYDFLILNQGTITALVPTQLYDLISLNLQAPSSLRAVIIGGGKLDEKMYEKGLELGWRVAPSYGATECCSQVATAPLRSINECCPPPLTILEHMEVKVDAAGLLAFKSESLLSGYAVIPSVKEGDAVFYNPVKDGWFVSNDRGLVEGSYLTCLGRVDSLVKINGELVDIDALNRKLRTVLENYGIKYEMQIFAEPEERSGVELVLVTTLEKGSLLNAVLERFHQFVMPYERIKRFYFIESFPRTALGKINREELFNFLIYKKNRI